VTDAQYREAAELGVVVHGRPPTSQQWEAIRRDLLCEPFGGRWWRQRTLGCSLVMVAHKVTDHPTYVHVPEWGHVSGLGWPVPVFSAHYSYPLSPNGVGRGGICVPLHEGAHTLCNILGTSQWPLWRQGMWQKVMRRAGLDWWDVVEQPGDDLMSQYWASERWANNYAAWCLWLGGVWEPIGAFLDRKWDFVRDYFFATTDAAGWRVPRPGVA
jgi:hypothetical protein